MVQHWLCCGVVCYDGLCCDVLCFVAVWRGAVVVSCNAHCAGFLMRRSIKPIRTEHSFCYGSHSGVLYTKVKAVSRAFCDYRGLW